MCARGKKSWKAEGRDAIGIVFLSLLVILVRTLFAPAPIVLPAPHEFVQDRASEPPGLSMHAVEQVSGIGAKRNDLFSFDPNTLDSAGFLRLGFSAAQTHALLNYRASGAQFRKPEDFSRAYVVSDEMYSRLAPYIQIEQPRPIEREPLQTAPETDASQTTSPYFDPSPPTNRTSSRQRVSVEINSADTSQLKRLQGIGPYYALKIVQLRERLGGFVLIEQLLDVEGIDEERLALFAPQVEIDYSLVRKIDLKSADQATLSKHPYIGPYAARWLVHYRQQLGDTLCTPQSLLRRNILKPEQARMLLYYVE